jgi:hypothetical protein
MLDMADEMKGLSFDTPEKAQRIKEIDARWTFLYGFSKWFWVMPLCGAQGIAVWLKICRQR